MTLGAVFPVLQHDKSVADLVSPQFPFKLHICLIVLPLRSHPIPVVPRRITTSIMAGPITSKALINCDMGEAVRVELHMPSDLSWVAEDLTCSLRSTAIGQVGLILSFYL